MPARFLLGIALASALSPARAEEGQAVESAPTRHHLTLGGATPSIAEVSAMILPHVGSALFRTGGRWNHGFGMVARVERDSAFGSVGLIYGLSTSTWTETGVTPVGRADIAVHTLQAQLLWRYVDREHLSVYSGLAGGLIHVRDRERGGAAISATAFGVSLTPVGLAVGGRNLRAYGELGIGLSPLLSGGVTYQF